MRIISGYLKGRKLAEFTAPHIRPMTDRVKESIFNTLQPCLSTQTRFLDLFSGTGNLSLEALSRGARMALAVECELESIRIIEKNQKMLKQPRNLIIKRQDVFSFIQAYRGEPFDIIIADPPFDQMLGDRILTTLLKSHLYKKETLILIETSFQEQLSEQVENFKLFSKKNFGDKKVWFYEAKSI